MVLCRSCRASLSCLRLSMPRCSWTSSMLSSLRSMRPQKSLGMSGKWRCVCMYVCMHVCIDVYGSRTVCQVYSFANKRMTVHTLTYINTCIHTYIHTYIHVSQTIGDCYKAVIGGFAPCADHAHKAMCLAAAILEIIRGIAFRYSTNTYTNTFIHTNNMHIHTKSTHKTHASHIYIHGVTQSLTVIMPAHQTGSSAVRPLRLAHRRSHGRGRRFDTPQVPRVRQSMRDSCAHGGYCRSRLVLYT